MDHVAEKILPVEDMSDDYTIAFGAYVAHHVRYIPASSCWAFFQFTHDSLNAAVAAARFQFDQLVREGQVEGQAAPKPLFTIGIDGSGSDGSVTAEISSSGIKIEGTGIHLEGISKLAAQMAPDILDREERRQAYETNHIEAARGTLMQALSFGSDEDREHAEDAVQDLVGFIGRQDEAGCDCNTSDAYDCGPRDSCSNCPPDIDTGSAETITAIDAESSVSAAGYQPDEPALFDRDGNPIPAEVAKIAFRHLATAREDARRKNNDDAMKRAEQIAAEQGGCLLKVSNTHGGGTVLSVFEAISAVRCHPDGSVTMDRVK